MVVDLEDLRITRSSFRVDDTKTYMISTLSLRSYRLQLKAMSNCFYVHAGYRTIILYSTIRSLHFGSKVKQSPSSLVRDTSCSKHIEHGCLKWSPIARQQQLTFAGNGLALKRAT
jgi:hypothetical protein